MSSRACEVYVADAVDLTGTLSFGKTTMMDFASQLIGDNDIGRGETKRHGVFVYVYVCVCGRISRFQTFIFLCFPFFHSLNVRSNIILVCCLLEALQSNGRSCRLRRYSRGFSRGSGTVKSRFRRQCYHRPERAQHMLLKRGLQSFVIKVTLSVAQTIHANATQ